MHVTGLAESLRAVNSYRARFERTVYDVFVDTAKDVTVWEKANHPWKNRTGEAERRIHCIALREGTKVVLENRHMVPYGKWLELRWNGRYAILMVALRRFWAQAMQNIVQRVHDG